MKAKVGETDQKIEDKSTQKNPNETIDTPNKKEKSSKGPVQTCTPSPKPVSKKQRQIKDKIDAKKAKIAETA